MPQEFEIQVTFVNKPAETLRFTGPSVVFGREQGDVVLGDPQSSGRHAQIDFVQGVVKVRDLGSTNGTWFAGQRQKEFVLQPGQSFQVGQTTVQLLAIHGAQPTSTGGGARTMIAFGGPAPSGSGHRVAPQAPSGWQAPARADVAAVGAPPQPGSAGARAPGVASSPADSPWGGGAPDQPQAAGPAPSAPAPGAPAPGWSAPASPPPPAAAPPPPASPPASAPPAAPAAGAPLGAWPNPAGGAAPPSAPVGGPPAPMVAGGPPAPVAPAPIAPAVRMPGAEVSLSYEGGGGELLGTVLLGVLLTLITAGIYLPWFICKLQALKARRTFIRGGAHGVVELSFHGTGGELFVKLLLGFLLTFITLYIYLPWFIAGLMRFFINNHRGRAADGADLRLHFGATGGDLLLVVLVQGILTAITVGIYAPWAICKVNAELAGHTTVLQGDEPIGQLAFRGQGGDLFVTFLLGYLLTLITAGIYGPWFYVKVRRFMLRGLEVSAAGRVFRGDFLGSGSEFFVIQLLGVILCAVTLYIYLPWFLVRIWKFELGHTRFEPAEGGPTPLQPTHPVPA